MSSRHRYVAKFLANPSSVRYATAAIAGFTVTVVVAGSLVMRIFDAEDYPTYREALWFTLQTVTTVGYGDTTPTTRTGQVVAAVVMLTAIALITVATAVITSVFVEAGRASAQRSDAEVSERRALAGMVASLDEVLERLERLETELSAGGGVLREQTGTSQEQAPGPKTD